MCNKLALICSTLLHPDRGEVISVSRSPRRFAADSLPMRCIQPIFDRLTQYSDLASMAEQYLRSNHQSSRNELQGQNSSRRFSDDEGIENQLFEYQMVARIYGRGCPYFGQSSAPDPLNHMMWSQRSRSLARASTQRSDTRRFHLRRGAQDMKNEGIGNLW